MSPSQRKLVPTTKRPQKPICHRRSVDPPGHQRKLSGQKRVGRGKKTVEDKWSWTKPVVLGNVERQNHCGCVTVAPLTGEIGSDLLRPGGEDVETGRDVSFAHSTPTAGRVEVGEVRWRFEPICQAEYS